MHSYLKAVGFSDIFGKKELDSILNNVINEYDEKIVAAGRAGHFFTELVKKYGDDFGIVVCGEYDENNEFQMEYYFPYFFGTGITLQEEVIIEKHAGHVSFAGACDDMRIGVTIIFYLQNAGEYLTQRNRGCNFIRTGKERKNSVPHFEAGRAGGKSPQSYNEQRAFDCCCKEWR